MTQNKRECEQGFLKGSREFYEKLGSYALQQTLKQRLEESYGSNAQNALETQMGELIEAGKDKDNFCKHHRYTFGIGATPMSEQLSKMDISLCSLLLHNMKDSNQNLLLTAQERARISEIRDGRNEYGHAMDTLDSDGEFYRPYWEDTAPRLEHFVNTSSLTRHISKEMLRQFDNYKQGRGSYIPPVPSDNTKDNIAPPPSPTPSSAEVEKNFKRLMEQHKISDGLEYLFQYASNHLLEKIYKEMDYSWLIQKFLEEKLKSEHPYWKGKCFILAKTD